MKTLYLRAARLLLCLNLVWSLGCTPQDTANPIAPEESSEILLENHQLRADETWDPERVYTVHGQLVVPEGITLTIPPGTTVRFSQRAHLTVRGVLKIGTPLEHAMVSRLVTLTADNIGPAAGDWGGILFDHTHGLESFIRGAVIEHATIAVDIKTTSPTLTESIFRTNETAIALDGSDARIQRNDIRDNHVGISSIGRQTRPKIERNTIVRNETGIFCENVQSTIETNNFTANIFALRLNVKFDLIANYNWWGGVDTAEIDRIIVDGADPGLITKQVGTVDYEPFIETQIADAGFPYPGLLSDP